MAATLDLDAYYRRIQWHGGPSPTYETLAGLLFAHTARIPFENLDALLGRPVRLDLDSIQNKLVRDNRGGYCFEHATLFAALLEALGFEAARHAARVVLFAPSTDVPRTHMFLTVPVGGMTYVVDPGFGPFGSRIPVPLVHGGRDAHGTHWMEQEDGVWKLLMERDERIVTGWVTTLEKENNVDFEVANHYIATHPDSMFVNSMMLSAVTTEGRVSVMNRGVTFLRQGQAHTTQLADRPALRALLVERFGFDLPEIDQLAVPAIPEWSSPGPSSQ